jgi:CRP-like cAMP-binding protein
VKLDLDTLRQWVPLDNLSLNSLEYVADNTRWVELRRDEYLYKLGDKKPMTFFLKAGVLELTDGNGRLEVVEAGSNRTRYAIGNLLPRQDSARVVSKTALLARVDKRLLEKEIAWGQIPGSGTLAESADDRDWRLALLRTPAFSRLPMAHVAKLFEDMEEAPYLAGQRVITEGETGDYYYTIRAGTCKVVRTVDGREVRLGTLRATDSFGDEALVSDKPRNATVVMETNGVLVRLSKERFQQLMQAPLLKRVTLSGAQRASASGKALLIDVRMEDEFAERNLPEARNIPLYLLYVKLRKFSKRIKYIVYCDTGARSQAAAFLLARNGFDAYVLDRGGLALASSTA